MSEMIERIAKAMYEAERGERVVPFEGALAQGVWIRRARAALTALEEPTEAMVEAAANLPGAFQGTSARYARVRETFHAMIQSAKGES